MEPSLQRKSPLEPEMSGISSSEKSLEKSLSLSLDINSFYYVTSMRSQTTLQNLYTIALNRT